MRLPSFVTGLLERVGLRKKQMPLSRDQAFEARPVRNPRLKWRINDEDFVEVIIPRGQDLFSRAMGFLFFVPKSRPVVLDEVGTRVWDLCDGENTVDEIIRELCSEYKLARREVEVSLTEFLRTLGKRGMVGFVVPKEFVEDFDGELVGLKEVGTTREELEAAQQEAARAVDEPEEWGDSEETPEAGTSVSEEETATERASAEEAAAESIGEPEGGTVTCCVCGSEATVRYFEPDEIAELGPEDVEQLEAEAIALKCRECGATMCFACAAASAEEAGRSVCPECGAEEGPYFHLR